jgi:polyphosphate kinase
VGRFLEHSRIYSFEAGDTTTVFFGSADLMPRNLDRRIEVVAPVESARARAEVNAILDSAFSDTTSAWELGPDGAWTRLTPDGATGHSHQAAMMRRAQVRARRARS